MARKKKSDADRLEELKLKAEQADLAAKQSAEKAKVLEDEYKKAVERKNLKMFADIMKTSEAGEYSVEELMLLAKAMSEKGIKPADVIESLSSIAAKTAAEDIKAVDEETAAEKEETA